MDLHPRFDVVVVGGGIVGLATAHALLERDRSVRVAVIEKEAEVALHQSGRNSGVLHSGIYYRPDSRKASLTAGRATMLRFCQEHGIPYDMTGKLIVAASASDLPRLDALDERAKTNSVTATRIGPEQIADVEPFVRGVAALHVADAGVVDFREVATTLAQHLRDAGAELLLGWRVLRLAERRASVVVETDAGDVEAGVVVNCAGLQAELPGARVGGADDDLRIIPFRGEFYEFVEGKRFLVRGLIYPVPDPAFPFLGVHLGRGIDGAVHAGPNAVLALAREGYSWRAVEWREVRDLARSRGMRRLARRHWRTGVREVHRSLSSRRFLRDVRRLVPEIRAKDLRRSPAGVRAQAVSRDGDLLDDFEIRETPRMVHVLNAPSPAATASLEIGRSIAELVATRLA